LSQRTKATQTKLALHRLFREGVGTEAGAPLEKVLGLTEKPTSTASIPSTGTIIPQTFNQANTISSYETELSSKTNKACTKLDKYYSSLDSKPLVLKPMESSTTMKMTGKRLILPKTMDSKINSMSLKNVNKNQIFKGHYDSSKGKIVIRTAYPVNITAAAKKDLQIKPKIITQPQNTTQPQIIIVQNPSQALVADAELIPARNQAAYNSVLARNSCEDANTIKTNNNDCTISNDVNNTDTVAEEYLNYSPKEFDPFLSDSKLIELTSNSEKTLDTSSIELVHEIETLNKDSKLEDIEKGEKIIAEGYIPITTTVDKMEDKMDFDFLNTWGADALYNDTQSMEIDSQPMDAMMMVNPLEAEGKSLENTLPKNETTFPTSSQEEQTLNTPQPDNENLATPDDIKEAMETLDEDFVASVLNAIENNTEECTTENSVPAENNLLEMVINDSIGIETVAEFCNEPLTTVNPQDIGINTNNDTATSDLPIEQEANQDNEEKDPDYLPKRKGPGRPRKPRTDVRVPKPRGRPSKLHLNAASLMSEHHNYSNSSASSSASSVAEKRYRRMRDLNNLASQRCRLKRKSKMHTVLKDLKDEEERNAELTMKVRVLEEQVKGLKARFIRQIANPTTATVETPNSEWNRQQLERFVDDMASKHLGM